MIKQLIETVLRIAEEDTPAGYEWKTMENGVHILINSKTGELHKDHAEKLGVKSKDVKPVSKVYEMVKRLGLKYDTDSGMYKDSKGYVYRWKDGAFVKGKKIKKSIGSKWRDVPASKISSLGSENGRIEISFKV